MDAATAALLGASLGLGGTVIAPLVTASATRRHKQQDLMREVYDEGLRSIAALSLAKDTSERINAYSKMVEAMARIQLAGSNRAADHFTELTLSLQNRLFDKDPTSSNAVKSNLQRFKHYARNDCKTNKRLRRFWIPGSANRQESK